MVSFILSVLSGLFVATIGVAAGFMLSRLQMRRKLGHLQRLLPPDKRVQIVLPSTQVSEFTLKGDGTSAKFPPNVLIMPMAEGIGIARLVLALRSLSKPPAISFTTDQDASREYSLTISVGGPSVNTESARLLREHPQFTLRYPEHVATYGSTTFTPKRNDSNELLEDFGFVFSHHQGQRRSLVCCGVWGIGTDLAIRGVLDHLREHDQEKALLTEPSAFAAFHAPIDGLRVGEPTLVHVAYRGRSQTWH